MKSPSDSFGNLEEILFLPGILAGCFCYIFPCEWHVSPWWNDCFTRMKRYTHLGKSIASPM